MVGFPQATQNERWCRSVQLNALTCFVPSCLCVFVLGLLLLSMTTAAAKAPLWTAWLYNAASGDLTLLDDGGAVLDGAKLPLPARYEFYPFDVAVAPNGTRIAYVASQGQGRRVLVYETTQKQLLMDYKLPSLLTEGMDFTVESALKFNESGRALALGYALKDGGWQVAVLDVQSALVTLILRDSQARIIPNEQGVAPVVQHYQGAEVTFTMVKGDEAAGRTEQGSYVWNTTSNTVREDAAYPTLDNDTYAPTGEVVSAGFDAHLPNSSQAFSDQQANALFIFDPTTKTRHAFYNAQALSLYFPRFIENGRRVLAGTFDAQGKPGWLILERVGASVGKWSAPEGTVVGSLRGTAEGFLYTANTVDPAGGHVTLLTVKTSDGLTTNDTVTETGTPLWSSPPGSYPRIVWLKDTRLKDTGDYKAWAEVSIPKSP